VKSVLLGPVAQKKGQSFGLISLRKIDIEIRRGG
jgi:hypothetical protein